MQQNLRNNPRQVADINGDGRADIVGFRDNRVFAALGQSDGTFGAAEVVYNNFVLTTGPTDFMLRPRHVADVNGDGQADLIRFGSLNTITALANPSETLIGGDGRDTLVGGAGFDTMTGDFKHSRPNTRLGGEDSDTFVLGDTKQAFYLGLGYATITDFNRGEGDKIQLHGNRQDYSLGQSQNFGGSNQRDTAIYYRGDLIGVVQDTTIVSLNSDFNFV